MMEKMNEIRDKHTSVYMNRGIKVPKETWLLIKQEIDDIIYPDNWKKGWVESAVIEEPVNEIRMIEPIEEMLTDGKI